jgi:hypothetical protein
MKVRAESIVHDCLFDESEHRGLSVGAVYDVVGLDDDHFRVIDDNDQPFLYLKVSRVYSRWSTPLSQTVGSLRRTRIVTT